MSKWKLKRDSEPTFVPKKNKDKDKNKNKSSEENKNNSNSFLNKVKNLTQDENENKQKKDYLQDELKKNSFSIKDFFKGFVIATISPRKGTITRSQFFWYLIILLFIALILLVFSAGSALEYIAPIICGIFFLSFVAQRFKCVGLKWYFPYISALLTIFALFTGGIITNAMDLSGDNTSIYNAMVNSISMINDTINNKLMFGVTFMSTVIVIYLLFIILNIIICFLRDGFFVKARKWCWIYLITSLITTALLPIGSFIVMDASNGMIIDATNTLYKSIFTQQEDGSYLINGTFISGTDGADFDAVTEYYNDAANDDDLTNEYQARVDYMTEYNDNLRISSLIGQNATHSGKVVGVLELGVVKVPGYDQNDTIIVEDITVDGIQKIVKQEFNLEKSFNFLMLEVQALHDTSEIIITTIINGERKILRSNVIDYAAELAAEEQYEQEQAAKENGEN